MQETAYRAQHIPKYPGDSNAFVLQPGSFFAPTLLRINEFNNNVYIGKGVEHTTGIPAEDTARDLVSTWRDNKGTPADEGLPAIWVCSFDQVTVEQAKALPETQEWYERQIQFASSKVREARLFAASNQWRNITKLHMFMGRLLNIQGESWQDFDAKNQVGKVRCQYCDAPQTIGVAICGTCREIVDIEKYNQIRAAQNLPPKAIPAAAAKPS
jgi:hypothetical protein